MGTFVSGGSNTGTTGGRKEVPLIITPKGMASNTVEDFLGVTGKKYTEEFRVVI